MRNIHKLILVTGMTAVLALTGCQTGSSDSSDRSAGRALDDKMITETVKEKLREEPVYKFSDVDVKTFGGVVQLSGFVNTQDQKQRAAELAREVQGVTQVVDNITLKPNLTPTGAPNNVSPPR